MRNMIVLQTIRIILIRASFLFILPFGYCEAASQPPDLRTGADVGKILVYPYRANTTGITIVGELASGDEDAFRRSVLSILQAGKLIQTVRIYSPGGDPKAAIDIGNQIRTLNTPTYAPFQDSSGKRTCVLDSGVDNLNKWSGGTGLMHYDASTGLGDKRCMCESACFLSWIAGVGRYGESIGIHRVFFAPGMDYCVDGMCPNISASWAEEHYAPVKRIVTEYLQGMGAPDGIISRLFATDINDMHYLNHSELLELRNDPPELTALIQRTCGPRPTSDDSALDRWISCGYALGEPRLRDASFQYQNKYGR
jgi:hypothetical protein